MKEGTNWLFVIVSFCSLLGLLVSVIVFFVNKAFASRILAMILFCMSYSLFAYGLYISREFVNYPHLWRTPAFFSLCVAPLTYIYTRSLIDPDKKPRQSDLLLFLPAVFYTIQLIPFYLLPDEEKLVFIQKAIESKSYGAREHEGLIPPGLAVLFRMTYNLGILAYTFNYLFSWKKKHRAELGGGKNKSIYHWLLFLNGVLLMNFATLIVGYGLKMIRVMENFQLPTLAVMFSMLIICLYLLLKPEILYGIETIAISPDPPSGPEREEVPGKITRRVPLSIEQSLGYKALIESHFCKATPFLKPRYSIKDLANEINVPSYLISAVINREYGKNFSEFVNDNRVSYLINRANEDPQVLQYTLEGLGQLGGFNSRASFIEAVKRRTGKMPSEVFAKK